MSDSKEAISKWKFPDAEGIYIDKTNGRWSDGAFFEDEFEDDEIEWHQAEPMEWVDDVDSWERWLEYLNTPRGKNCVHRMLVVKANAMLLELKR